MSDYDLNFQVNIETELDLPLARLRRAIEWIFDMHEVPSETGISLVITDNDTIQELNREFRHVDAPTDVLSFPAEPIPGEDDLYMGDLILALPYIQRQAEAEGHTLSDELALAVIHGTLHLLGYDHDTSEHQELMWTRQAEALRAMNVNIIVPPFEFPDDE
jgi:probable rRNA maturation factor